MPLPFTFSEWEDPRCFNVNKEAPHCALFAAESREVALSGDRQRSARHLSLNGTWRFHWAARWADRAPAGFEQPDYDDSAWGGIAVPGSWELQGHGFPIYTHVNYIFEHSPPTIQGSGISLSRYHRGDRHRVCRYPFRGRTTEPQRVCGYRV